MINILIRTHNRMESFKRCLESVFSQSYTDYRLIISVQSELDYSYVRPLIRKGDKIFMVNDGEGFFYNLHCNKLKSAVNDGYFFFLDDDDTLEAGALEAIAQHLEPDTALIVQLNRQGWLKPTTEMVDTKTLIEAQIGMPCMVLHHSHKDLANIENHVSGDYLWIKSVLEKIESKWIHQVLVNSPRRGYGRSI